MNDLDNDLESSPPLPPLRHEAFFYTSLDEYLAATTTFVRSALTRGRATLVAVPQPRLDAIRGALGDSTKLAHFADLAETGRNPSCIIPCILADFCDHDHALPVAVICESMWPERTRSEKIAGIHHEALVNLAFAEQAMHILCPYDAGRHQRDVLEAATHTHPILTWPHGGEVNPRYRDPLEVARACAQHLEPVPREAHGMPFGPGGLRHVRHEIRRAAEASGLDRQKVDDLELAVSEVVTNTAVHTGQPGYIRWWHTEPTFTCEIRDRGQLRDPLAGRRLADPTSPTGRGLLIAHQLCDVSDLYFDADGTTVRLQMYTSGRS